MKLDHMRRSCLMFPGYKGLVFNQIRRSVAFYIENIIRRMNVSGSFSRINIVNRRHSQNTAVALVVFMYFTNPLSDVRKFSVQHFVYIDAGKACMRKMAVKFIKIVTGIK